MSRRGRPPKWSPEVKAEALALAAEVGAEEAGQRLGVPGGTVRWWCHELTSTVAATLPAVSSAISTDRALRSWAERRPILLEACGEAAMAAKDALMRAIEQDNARNARDYAATFGIVTDKALLLGGQANRRTENYHVHATTPDPEVAKLEAEIVEMEAELSAWEDDQ